MEAAGPGRAEGGSPAAPPGLEPAPRCRAPGRGCVGLGVPRGFPRGDGGARPRPWDQAFPRGTFLRPRCQPAIVSLRFPRGPRHWGQSAAASRGHVRVTLQHQALKLFFWLKVLKMPCLC